MTNKGLLTQYLREQGITDEEILIMFKHGHDKRMAKTLGFALFRLGLAWGEVKSEFLHNRYAQTVVVVFVIGLILIGIFIKD